MQINFHTSCLEPMANWLLKSKKTGIWDEVELRNILSMPDYQIELARYNDANLPVCGITLEEAVDFFLHFDSKDFSNQRLQIKKESFSAFYADLENKLQHIAFYEQLSPSDQQLIEGLLQAGLPDALVDEKATFNIIFIISIGNSMGWPFQNYLDFDVVNLDLFGDRETFLHVIAHEIHHTYFNQLLPEEVSPQAMFFLNFAFEGLAVHYNNNAGMAKKPSKYDGPMFSIVMNDWQMYESQFHELFQKLKADALKAKTLTLDEVEELISTEYEQFTFYNIIKKARVPISQYPTYYLGCYLWGSIDLAFGKEKVFAIMKEPNLFIETYNEAAIILKNGQYLL